MLEHLPAGAPRASTQIHAPADAAAAARLARAYIEQARRTGDPRFLGYAEGALKPWWNEAVPPPAVLLLRATLLQSRHQFADALRDLDALLAREPRNAQARLTRATILRVQGRYDEAEQACASLDTIASAFITDLCIASVRGLHGQLPAMAAELDAMAGEAAQQPPDVRAWYRAERADMAERLGQDADAVKRYRTALAEDPDDPLLRAAAADLSLRLRKPHDALAIAGEQATADVLRLRVALARRALGTPDEKLEAALADTYASAHRRGEDVHLREEARFVFDIQRNAARALGLARQNWVSQREPADALLLDATARATGTPDAALATWLRETKMQDARFGR